MEPGKAKRAISTALALALAALASGAAAAPARQAPPPPPPNLLLLTVDTLRPDALGWVAGRGATPALDALAAAGFAFPAAAAPAPITLPSHISMLTGLVPRRHGVRDNGQVLGTGPPTLAEILRRRGYATAAFVSGYPLSAFFGLDRGFEIYDDAFTRGGGEGLERPAAETTTAALDWARRAPEPWFLWVHCYDPHDPYEPPAAFRRPGPRGAYDGEVAYVDQAAGTLLRALAEGGRREPLTVFAADHGESLGEHGEATHGFFLYESTLAVPLVFRFPERVKPGRSAAAARLVDITPTVLDLLGLRGEIPAGLDGVSLAPLLRGEEQEIPPAYLETLRPWTSYGWSPLRAVRHGGWKLIAAPRPELYHLTEDPGEQNNLVDEERPVGRRLQAHLRAAEATPAAAADPAGDPEALARLRALGYAGAGRRAGEEPPPGLPDPKDRLDLWNTLGAAEALLAAGRHREAVERFDTALAAEPANPFALARSGIALVEAGDFAAAVPRLTRAAHLDPADAEIRYALAHALTRLKRYGEAVEQWMEMARLQPRRLTPWVNLGSTLGLAGEVGRAVAAFRRARELAPEDPAVLARLAFAEHAAGHTEEAVAHLEEAAARAADGFSHAGALGLLLLELKRPAEARPWLARGRPGERDFAAARYELARLEAAAGDRTAARRALEEALAASPALRPRAASDPALAPLLP